jgi:hypothetical protein
VLYMLSRMQLWHILASTPMIKHVLWIEKDQHFSFWFSLLTSKLIAIPACAQYVTLQKYFSHPSLAIYFFATPPIRLKLGLTDCK